MESSLKIINDHTIAGFGAARHGPIDQYVYFVIEFSNPFSKYGIWER